MCAQYHHGNYVASMKHYVEFDYDGMKAHPIQYEVQKHFRPIRGEMVFAFLPRLSLAMAHAHDYGRTISELYAGSDRKCKDVYRKLTGFIAVPGRTCRSL